MALPTLAETSHTKLRRGSHADAPQLPARAEVSRWEAELRCLLASLRHADRELRIARSSIASTGAPSQPERLRRSRSLDREELQAQLVETKLRAAQLEFERDEQMMAVRRLTNAQRGSVGVAAAPSSSRLSRASRRRKSSSAKPLVRAATSAEEIARSADQIAPAPAEAS